MAKGSRLKVAISIALAVALLGFFLAKADLRDVGRRIGQLAPGFLLLSVACSLSGLFLRAWRWQFLLRPAGGASFGPVFAATSIGFAASTILPARAGEVVRPVVLSRRTRVPLSAGLASVLFERVIDLTTVLLFFLVYCLAPGLRPAFSGEAAAVFASLRVLAMVSGLAAALFYAAAVIATGKRAAAERAVSRLIARLPERFGARARAAFSSFLDGMHAVRQPATLAVVGLLSPVIWAVVCGQVYFLCRAFRLSVPPSGAILIVVVTLIGLAIPTPGGVGGFHKLCQVALTMFYGVDLDAATGLAIVYWFVAFAPVTLIGFWLFAAGSGSGRASLADLAEAGAKETI